MNGSRLPLPARLERFGRTLENLLLILLLALMIGLGATQIVQRNIFGTAFVWSDELLRLLVLWLALAGAIAASRDDRHITIDILSRILPEGPRLALRLVLDLFTVAVCLLLAWHAGRFVLIEREYGSTLLGGLPAWPFEAVIPLGFALIAYRYGMFLVLHLQKLRTTGREL